MKPLIDWQNWTIQTRKALSFFRPIYVVNFLDLRFIVTFGNGAPEWDKINYSLSIFLLFVTKAPSSNLFLCLLFFVATFKWNISIRLWLCIQCIRLPVSINVTSISLYIFNVTTLQRSLKYTRIFPIGSDSNLFFETPIFNHFYILSKLPRNDFPSKLTFCLVLVVRKNFQALYLS